MPEQSSQENQWWYTMEDCLYLGLCSLWIWFPWWSCMHCCEVPILGKIFFCLLQLWSQHRISMSLGQEMWNDLILLSHRDPWIGHGRRQLVDHGNGIVLVCWGCVGFWVHFKKNKSTAFFSMSCHIPMPCFLIILSLCNDISFWLHLLIIPLGSLLWW